MNSRKTLFTQQELDMVERRIQTPGVQWDIIMKSIMEVLGSNENILKFNILKGSTLDAKKKGFNFSI